MCRHRLVLLSLSTTTTTTTTTSLKRRTLSNPSAAAQRTFTRTLTSLTTGSNRLAYRRRSCSSTITTNPPPPPLPLAPLYRHYSAPATSLPPKDDDNQPQGDLFVHDHTRRPDASWIGQSARIKRTFGAQANADAMLLCGGAALAAHASFDPHYRRAATWIHNHAVGPAVLSPVLTLGLVHTLTEAAFPHSVPLSQAMQQVRPLIVGVSVYATIEVQQVTNRLRGSEEQDSDNDNNNTHPIADAYAQQRGYQVDLKAVVSRVRDNAVISQGNVSIWLADLQQQQQQQQQQDTADYAI